LTLVYVLGQKKKTGGKEKNIGYRKKRKSKKQTHRNSQCKIKTD